MSNYEPLFERPTGSHPPREVLRHGIMESILNGETALFDVLPGLGKSRTAATTGELYIPISVFTNLEDNYDQFEDWCNEFGVESEKFPRSNVACSSLNGEHPVAGPVREARNALDNDWPVSKIHEEYDLPCQQNGECEYIEKVQNLKIDGPGLLIGYYTQAYVRSYTKDRVVVLDEDAFGEFYETITNPAQKAQDFIDSLNNFPLDDLRRLDGEERDEILQRLEDIGLEPEDHTNSVGDFHAKAPLIAYAIYGAEELDNGLKYIELPGDRTAVFDKWYATNGDATIWLLDPPDLSQAEAVIGLDATPCIPKWERILGDDFNHYRLFEDDDRNQYLRDKGYEFIQLNTHAWPSQGGALSIGKCEAYLREVYQEHRERPDLITSMDIRNKLEEQGLDDLWDRDLHFGDLRGKNDIKDSELLVVLGSPSRSDNYFKHLAALFGESADRVENTSGRNLSFDSPIGDKILERTRRGGVFQAAMRAGRDDDANATVYIATGLVPEWLETKTAGRRLPNGSFDTCPKSELRSSGEREVIEALRSEEGITTSELVEKVSIGREMVNNHRKALQDRGLVEKEGKCRWAKYSDSGLETLNIAGEVDLSLSGNNRIKGYIWGKYPIGSRSQPIVSRRDPPDDPEKRYPDWMRDVQIRARDRRMEEQIKHH